tara:strand:- start:146 stop:337 length:192 start_codon:yes stop_codon:yes gene_type:complete
MKTFRITLPRVGMFVERRFKCSDVPRNQQVAGVIVKVRSLMVEVQWPDMSRETISIDYLRRMT